MRPYVPNHAERPGRVTAVRGVVFQSDGRSTVGRLFIRPFEALDRTVVGILPAPGEPSLAMHAGLHVEIDGQYEFVVEQLVGSWYMDFRNGLNWTPLDDFRQRDRGGWDLTIPCTAFRGVDEVAVASALDRLNLIQGHPFAGEDCTAFIERAFSGRRLFADSPVLRKLGIGVRIGDPALPLLERDAPLDERARRLLAFETIRDLEDPLADADSPNASLWLARLVPTAVLGALVGRAVAELVGYSSTSRRSSPASSTARRFFR